MTDRRSGEKHLRELEFNNLNIHLYLTLNYGTASEHLDFDFMVLYNAFCAFTRNTTVKLRLQWEKHGIFCGYCALTTHNMVERQLLW